MRARHTQSHFSLTRLLMDLIKIPLMAGMAIGLMVLVIGACYAWAWRTLPNFVRALDDCSQFMQDFARHYLPMADRIVSDPRPVSGYFYSAFFALALTPLTALTGNAAMVVWLTVQAASVAALGTLTVRALRGPLPFRLLIGIGLYATSVPILHNIIWGQVSTLLTACVIGAVYASRNNKSVLAGVLLAFAAAVKFYPAFFLVYFILKRDFRACAAFLLAGLAFYALLPATVLGPAPWWAFENAVQAAIGQAGWVSENANSQYIVHVGRRWFELFAGRQAGAAFGQALALLGGAVALFCIALAWVIQRKKTRDADLLALVGLFLAIPFVIRTSWPHYFVYLPFCEAVLLARCAPFGRNAFPAKTPAVLTLMAIGLSSTFAFIRIGDSILYNGFGLLFAANLLLLVTLCAIARRPEGGRVPPPASSSSGPGPHPR